MVWSNEGFRKSLFSSIIYSKTSKWNRLQNTLSLYYSCLSKHYENFEKNDQQFKSILSTEKRSPESPSGAIVLRPL